MDPRRLLNLTCTVTSRTQTATPDAMGDPTYTETTDEWRCWLQQEQRSEDTVNTDVQQQRWTLFLESDALVTGSDLVTVGGVVYEFDGPPWPATHPRSGVVTHLEATVRRTQ